MSREIVTGEEYAALCHLVDLNDYARPRTLLSSEGLSAYREMCMAFWIRWNRYVHAVEREQFAEHVDLGGD